MDPKMLLKVVRNDRVQIGGLLFAPLTDVDLTRALKLTHVKDLARNASQGIC